MKPDRAGIFAGFSILQLVTAGGGETWNDVPAKETVTYTETKYVPTVEIQTVSVTDYVTDYQTDTVTDYQTVTEVSTSTEVTTETESYTDTETVTVVSTITQGYTDVATATITVVQTVTQGYTDVSVETITITVTEDVTLTNVGTITEVDTVATTIYDVETTTTTLVEDCSAPPPVITGLVPCPKRIVNPTYSLPAGQELPQNYTWGCAPGFLCTPKQVDCNFEADLPEDTYYCSPDECQPVPFLPPYEDNPDGPWDETWDCGKLFDPVPGYFNFDPKRFGLDYWVFDFGGQTPRACPEPTPVVVPPPPPPPAPPAPPTTWVDVPPPAPPATWVDVPAPPVSSHWVDVPAPPVSSHWVDVPAPPVSTHWVDVVEPPAPGNWADTDPVPAPPAQESSWGDYGAKPPALLLRRQTDEEIKAAVPQKCFSSCEQCSYSAQKVGKVRALLCDPDTDFQNHAKSCRNCVKKNKDGDPNDIPPLLNQLKTFFDFCDEPAEEAPPSEPEPAQTSTSTPPQPTLPEATTAVATVTTTAPAETPAVGTPSASASAPSTPIISTISPPTGSTPTPATYTPGNSATPVALSSSGWLVTLLSMLVAIVPF